MQISHRGSYLHGSYMLTNVGLKPDEEKMWATTEFPVSHDLHHLRRFIGMVKYLSKFDHSLMTKQINTERPGFPMSRGTTKSF